MLLTALAEPLVGDPLGADEDRAARVHGGLVARAVPEQLGKERGGKQTQISDIMFDTSITKTFYV